MPIFEKVKTKDADLQGVQENVGRALDPVLRVPMLAGRLLEELELPGGAINVSHLLGRVVAGWFPVRKDAETDIWDEQDSLPTQLQSKFLRLNSTGPVTISVWVF